ncbi:hypothetical protein HY357_01020 [Candidatus Roizmanbacteria bacterium]|nr:hypothetical protein [Candidatus Roizmanbacteria bacterium]
MERRAFLRISTYFGLASLFAACNNLPIFQRQLFEEELRLNIQDTHGISLLDKPDGYDKWDRERLAMLDKFLGLLPESFYRPKFADKKLRIHLTSTSNDGYCECTTINGINNDIIGLNIVPFNPSRRDISLEVLAHEATHRASQLTAIIDVGINSPYFKPLESILGGDFLSVREKLYDSLLAKQEGFIKKIQDTHYPRFNWDEYEKASEIERFYTYFLSGLGKRIPPDKPSAVSVDTPVEFIAVLGQNYVKGKPVFYQNYSKVFETTQVNSLYDFTKDIFDGKEYLEAPVPLVMRPRQISRRHFLSIGFSRN